MLRARALTLLVLLSLLVQNLLLTVTPSSASLPSSGVPAADRTAAARPAIDPSATRAAVSTASGQQSAAAESGRTAVTSARPLIFEPNDGQTNAAVRFLAHAPGGTFFFTPAEVVLALALPLTDTVTPAPSPTPTSTPGPGHPPAGRPRTLGMLRVRFVAPDANATLRAGTTLPGQVHYLQSNARGQWRTNLPAYANLAYQNLYPGITLTYSSTAGHLKGTYTVAPGADPAQIRWRYEGLDRVQLDPTGNLQIRLTPIVRDPRPALPITVTEQAPLAWQEIGERQVPVSTSYSVAPNGSIGFTLGTYDHTQPLLIDPTLEYATYLGGAGDEDGRGIALDPSGNIYVTGQTASTDFPVRGAPYPTRAGTTDAFVAKFDRTGALVYATYLGGNGDDISNAIAVDPAGNAYLTGNTGSQNFPLTSGALQDQFVCAHGDLGGACANNGDAFLVKLNAAGTSLLYSTYLGGTGPDSGNAIALDRSGIVYLTGTAGTDWVTTKQSSGDAHPAYQETFQTGGCSVYNMLCSDAFVAKINPNAGLSPGQQLLYSTFFGVAKEVGYGIAVDSAGNAYITGHTDGDLSSTQRFPIKNAIQPTYAGGGDAFIAKLNLNAGGEASLVYSTYFGYQYSDTGRGIAIDAAQNVYVTGESEIPPCGFFAPCFQAFVTKVNAAGTAWAYTSAVGGSNNDYGNGIVVDSAGQAFITGATASANLGSGSTYQGNTDAFIAGLDTNGQGPTYFTYLGGTAYDAGKGIVLDGQGNAYVTGATSSTDFPATTGAFHTQSAGGSETFVAKLTDLAAGGPSDLEALAGACSCAIPQTKQPVNTATGNFWHSFADLSVPGRGIPLQFNHTYNSLAANVDGPLGYGWTHSYNVWVDSTDTEYQVHRGDGSLVPFPKSGPAYHRVLAQFSHNVDGTYTLTDTHGLTRYSFRTDGKLAQLTDRNGYTTSLSYDATGRLEAVTDPAQRALTFSYDPTSGRLVQVTDPTGRYVTFAYTSADLTTATDVGRQPTQFSYYTGHLLHTMTDPNGGVISNTYDNRNRVVLQTDPLNRSLQFAYTTLDVAHTQTVLTDSLGSLTVYTFDQNRLVTLTRNPGTSLEATWQYTYAAAYPMAVAAVTDPLGHTARYTWDRNGNQLSATDPLGRTTSSAYNATNDLLVVTNTLGLTTSYTYDPNGNLLSVTRPVTETNELAVSHIDYDPAQPGAVRSVTDPLGHAWQFAYNALGYVLTSTNPLAETTRFTPDALGRVVAATDPLNHTAQAAYDVYGAPIVLTNTLGYTSTYGYDPTGNLLTVTDANFHTITRTYNLDHAVTRVTQPDGTHSDTGYDAGGRVISQTNGLGQTTRYSYNAANQLIAVTDPLTRTTQYGYDLTGHTTVLTDAMGLVTSYSYDPADQLRAISYSDGTTPNVAFDYNALGLRTVMTDGTGVTLYSYDSLARLRTVQNGAQATVGYSYDLGNRLTSLTYPGGTVTRGYDDADRLRTITDWLQHTTAFDYDPTGALIRTTYPNGVQGARGYNAAGQLTSLVYTNTQTANVFLNLSYQPDPVGVLAATTEAGVGTNTYSYDPQYRLTGDTRSTISTRGWGYDGATQILTTSVSLPPSAPLTTVRSYDAASQLRSLIETQNGTTTRNLTLGFDPRGNRTSQSDSIIGSSVTYGYDQANRLISLTGASSASYNYNGDGLRTSKTVVGTTMAFTWDVAVGLPLLLADGTASYIYGPGGQILEQIQGSSAYYYHSDRLGSVRTLTNEAGSVVTTYAYDAYGATTAKTGTVTNPFRYAGEYTDTESGLIYLRARYYDPVTQQFLTVDPLQAVTGQAYAYAAGNAINLTDPAGLWVRCLSVGGYQGIGAGLAITFYHCAAEGGEEQGVLASLSFQGSTTLGASLAVEFVWSDSAKTLDDMAGWSVGFGGTLGVGKNGVVSDWSHSKGTDVETCAVGWSFGSPVGIPFIEVHGGLSYTWILSRSHDGIPPSDYGYDNYQKILDGPRRSWDNVPYEQRGGVPWDAP